MRVLQRITPTPEQLKIFSRNRPGVEVIRGAAGSGKTTTALLRLRSLAGMFSSRKQRLEQDEPVRILVLTYNRTLRGYIEALAREQVYGEVDLEIQTFAKWACEVLGHPDIIDEPDRERKLVALGRTTNLPERFLLEEVEYVMGRYLFENLEDYLSARRIGRGSVPRMEREARRRLLHDVVLPYQSWIDEQGLWDWNDLALRLAVHKIPRPYDVVVADETQDFSANQIRAIKNQLAEESCLTLVVDTAQRIYARGFTWSEVGIAVRPTNSYRLSVNYRNTKQIARFALPLLEGLEMDDDGTIPDFKACTREGPMPVVLCGRYSAQVDYVVEFLRSLNLSSESVAILHPLGGGWFSFLRSRLLREGIDFVEITRRSDWPEGEVNVALSTIHSAKGLEFDHVVIIGLNEEVTTSASSESDHELDKLRRLLAMGISRAKQSVVLGYKAGDASRVLTFLDQRTFTPITLAS